MQDVQGVQVLALVLVQPLHLDVEDAARVHLHLPLLGKVPGEVRLVVRLDLGQAVQHLLVPGVLPQPGKLGEVVEEPVPDQVADHLVETGVGLHQPPAAGDAVGDVFELLRGGQVEGVEHVVPDDLGMEGGNAVDAVAAGDAEVGHPHLAHVEDGHFADLALRDLLVPQLLAEAAVDLLDDLVDAGQQRLHQGDIPLLQRLAHNSVVGVGEGLGDDVPAQFPAVAAVVQQHPHQLRDGQGGVGVVDVDGVLLGKVVHGAVGGHVAAEDIPHCGGGQEVLLPQPEQLALGMVVVGVQHLADGLGVAALGEGPQVVPLVEEVHIDAGALGLPKAQQAHRLGVVAGDIHVVGDGQDGAVAGVVHHMVDAVPALLHLAAEVDLHGVLRHRLQPDLPAGEPVIGQFALPAVADLLLKDAVLVQDAVAGGHIAIGGKAVQVAGRQPPQAAVAKTGVGLAFVKVLQLYIIPLEGLLEHLHQPQVVKVVFEALAHQKLHGKVVDLLFAPGVVFGVAPLALGAQKVPQHDGARLVELLVKGVFRLYGHLLPEDLRDRLGDPVYIDFFADQIHNFCFPLSRPWPWHNDTSLL